MMEGTVEGGQLKKGRRRAKKEGNGYERVKRTAQAEEGPLKDLQPHKTD